MGVLNKLPEYEADLLDIWLYIAEDSPTNADRYLSRIEETVNKIADSPGMGRSAEHVRPGFRMFPIDNYLFFYREIKGGIEAVSIVSGFRDLEHLFSKEK